MHTVKYRDSLLWGVQKQLNHWDAVWNAESGESREYVLHGNVDAPREGALLRCVADLKAL